MSLLLSREKFHQLTSIFIAKIIIVNYNPFSKIFQSLSFVELTKFSKVQVINFQDRGEKNFIYCQFSIITYDININ